ncbi:MAG TPA: hypothetical protein VES62_00030 [Thermoleophilaceae bacterium]|nr:hypothetical protein [Thermoleophilaceae bacterium]
MASRVSWSQNGLEDMRIEPREGGFAYERGPHGFTINGVESAGAWPLALARFAGAS